MRGHRVARRVFYFFWALVALRALSLLPAIVDVDEAYFTSSAMALGTAPWRFFSRAVDNKPPGTAWFYWLVHLVSGQDGAPRLARLIAGLLLVLSARLLGRCALRLCGRREPRRPGARPRALVAGIAFLAATALPAPELLATTTEGLALGLQAVLLLGLLEALLRERELGVGEAFALGALTGLGLVLKQTLIMFFAPVALALWMLWRERQLRAPALGAALVGLLAPVAALAWLTGPHELWYWTIAYPAVVLRSARATLFDGSQALVLRSAGYLVVLWPLWRGLRARLGRVPSRARALLGAWLGAALCAVLAGQGLFYHYYLFFAPPLALAVALPRPAGARRRTRLGWLVPAAAVSCALGALPNVSLLWGTDLEYYSRVAHAVKSLSSREESVFVWGGSALPTALAGRRPATRFVTARFLVWPYTEKRLQQTAHADFLRNRPELVVDLHERHDERFDVKPSALPWLADELKRHYARVPVPEVPWARFYRRRGPLGPRRELAADVRTLPGAGSRVGAPLERYLRAQGAVKLGWRAVAHWSNTLALAELLRAWDAAGTLHRLQARGLTGEEGTELVLTAREELRAAIERELRALTGAGFVAPDAAERDARLAHRTSDWLRREFMGRRLRLPMSLDSWAWWASAAMVRFQPRMSDFRPVSG